MDRTWNLHEHVLVRVYLFTLHVYSSLCSPCIYLLVSVWMAAKSLNLNSSLRLFVVGEVEDGWGGGCADPISAGGGAAQTDHRDAQGHARPARGPSPRLPQHRHQGLRAPAPLPGLSQGMENIKSAHIVGKVGSNKFHNINIQKHSWSQSLTKYWNSSPVPCKASGNKLNDRYLICPETAH